MESHKIIGYVLLIVGLIVVIIAPIFAISILFNGASAIPKILETPVLSNTTTTSNGTLISTSNLNQIIGAVFPAVNVVLLLLIALILIYAGGVIMGKGVSLIKEIKLRAVREAVKEVSEEVEVKREKANEPEQSPAG
jgi:predicted membrane protein